MVRGGGPACTTVTSTGLPVAPNAVTRIVAVRCALPGGFASNPTVNVPALTPLAPEVIRAVLGRMPVPPAQRALYRALFQAGETGLNASDLAVAIKRTEQELAGVLGALGRRINRTPGVNPENPPGVDLMFEMKQQDGQWHYRMRDVLREVLEAEQPAWL